MIKNKRELATFLNNGGRVEIKNVSKKLNRIINLWISYKDIKIEDNFLIGMF